MSFISRSNFQSCLVLCLLLGCGKLSIPPPDTRSEFGAVTPNVFGNADIGWLPFENLDRVDAPEGERRTSSANNPDKTYESMDEGPRTRGKAIYQTGTVNIGVFSALLQTDGKVVSMGLISGAPYTDFLIFRQNTDGTFDTSFYTSGKAITDINGNDEAHGGVLQTDGKIVAIGQANSDFSLVRYNTNGSLDTTFNTNGMISTNLSGGDMAYGGVLQTDGKIIAFGKASGYTDYGLARYNTNGTLDTSFNSNGKVVTDISGAEQIHSGVLQTDGKFIAGGDANNTNDFGLARYNTNGTLDTSFNSTGTVSINISAGDRIKATLLQSDGKVLAMGAVSNYQNFGVVRYNTDGTLDTSFNSTGKVNTDISGIDLGYGGVLQADGKIGVIGVANNIDFAVLRYNTDGTLDTSFNSTGKIITDISGSDSAQAAVLQANGKIVAIGTANNFSNFALTRYNTDGTLDTAFSTSGKGSFTIAPSNTMLNSLLMDPNGNILGLGSVNPDVDFIVVRLNPLGVLDTTFNSSGKVITDISGSDMAYGGVLQSDGKIVAVGTTTNSVNFAIARYNSNGTLDTSFNSSGKVITDISGGDVAYGGVLQSDGKTIAIGVTNNNTTNDFGVVRYNTDGTLDTSFNSTGKVISDINGNDIANGGVLQSDGKTIAIGTINNRFGVARYNTDGTLDTSFNSTGSANTPISGTSVAYGGVLQSDGKLIAVGTTTNTVNFGIVRYNTNGTVDTSFNSNGKVTLDLGYTDIARAVRIAAQGKIVVVGSSYTNFSIARYLSSGNLDTTFHTGGTLLLTVGQGIAGAIALAISNGYYVIGGYAVLNNVYGFAVVKIAP